MRASIPRVVVGFTFVSVFAGTQPSLQVSGGITLNGVAQPLLFTWNSALPVAGGGWAAGEAVQIVLHGPLGPTATRRGGVRRPGVRLPGPIVPEGIHSLARTGPAEAVVQRELSDVPLGAFTADGQGNLSAAPVIPYDSGIVGYAARIPKPGYYQVRAIGAVSGTAAAPDLINLCPDTYTGAGLGYDWGHERGGRDGVLPGGLRQYSPERFDPEWVTTWGERPVEVYGTVAPTDPQSSGQPSQISYTDNPATHYGHDANFFVVPDAAYQWVIGTANYYSTEPDAPGAGRLEVEWETLNAGSTSSYGQGNIGLPVWANPTAGDRIYVLGRWILDAGHPETGDRTEIHPPRLVATMRQRPALVNGTAAAQVDIYASGHGGGANMMPPGLSEILVQGGNGGGRLRDVLSPADQDRYYRPGPLAPLVYPLLVQLVRELTGVAISAQVYSDAGPSAFPWGAPGAEQRGIDDMDYDFDVPLPPAPPGATSVAMNAVTQPQHTTGVNEVVTYLPANGLPSVAHIHLPYRGADNGIYARTLTFSWNQPAQPASHWVVRLNRINVASGAGKWQMWADVSGQWSYLTGLAPALLNTTAGTSVDLPGTPTDVYLNLGQTIRVMVQGYGATCVDGYFGKLFGESSYVAGLGFVGACGPNDNTDLGHAVLELPADASSVGTHTVDAKDAAGNRYFSVVVTVEGPT